MLESTVVLSESEAGGDLCLREDPLEMVLEESHISFMIVGFLVGDWKLLISYEDFSFDRKKGKEGEDHSLMNLCRCQI